MYWLTGILGLISAIAPFVLGYSNDTAALWTSLGVGAVLMIASAFEWYAQDKEAWEYWVAGIAGAGAVAAPFVLGFSGLGGAVWTLVIIGLITVIAAGTKLFSGRAKYGY